MMIKLKVCLSFPAALLLGFYAFGASGQGNLSQEVATDGSVAIGGLRGGLMSTKLEALAKTTEDHVALVPNLPAMSLPERVTLMKTLNNAVDETIAELASMKEADLGLVHHQQMYELLDRFIQSVESSQEARNRVIEFVEEAEVHRSSKKQGSNPDSNDDGEEYVHTKSRQRRRTQEDRSGGYNQGGRDGNSDYKDYFNSGFRPPKNMQDLYRQASAFGGRNGIHKAHKQRSGASSLLGRVVRRTQRRSNQEGRRLVEVEDKHHMCTQLAECVDSMSYYDLFVYFKSGKSSLVCRRRAKRHSG